jgi:hypothetical protein
MHKTQEATREAQTDLSDPPERSFLFLLWNVYPNVIIELCDIPTLRSIFPSFSFRFGWLTEIQ